ncbi:hypothetical protein FKP32DRAFT_1677590 [Trametes sanguinea]|nr:hypothetical protein FKP32DRAFT_1677590 [Trametes sanguinea]
MVLDGDGLDYLIKNAGEEYKDTDFTLDPDNLLHIMRVNVACPALFSRICLPFL